jgi:hypothetical protein
MDIESQCEHGVDLEEGCPTCWIETNEGGQWEVTVSS